VKPGSSLTASNTTFDTNLAGWSQSSFPLLTGTWTWVTDDSGSAEVTLTGNGENSKKIYQSISHAGGYIKITVSLAIDPSIGNTREDVLYALFYSGSSIVHTEKLRTFGGINSVADHSFVHRAFCPAQVDKIGFYIHNAAGTGTCTYRISEFTPEGTDITEIYQISDYQFDEYNNTYFFELMQQSKTYLSLSQIDDGGPNQNQEQGENQTGRAHSSGYSSAYE
jgi:hypothetical protein